MLKISYLNLYIATCICFFTNTYFISGTTTPTHTLTLTTSTPATSTPTTSTLTPTNINTLSNKCIHSSYCFPIIVITSTVLFTILLVQCWKSCVKILLIKKHSKKYSADNPVRYVVNEVYEYIPEDNAENNKYSEI